jgi:hypothetical protein
VNVEQLQQERAERGLCGCGCGESLKGRSARSLYLDARCRQRAYRERLNAAAEAAGVPAHLSLETIRAATPPGDRNGDAQTRRQAPPRRRTELRVSYRKLVALLDELEASDREWGIGWDSAFEQVRHAVEHELLTPKQRDALRELILEPRDR